jgi:hypothetical protein
MPRPLMFFVPAILIMPLAPTLATAQTRVAQPAADECRTKPDSPAPPGSHWYYRVNRTDQRQCWYLGAEGGKVRSQAREDAAPARAPARENPPEMMTRTMPHKWSPHKRQLPREPLNRRRQIISRPRSRPRKLLIRRRTSPRPRAITMHKRRQRRRRQRYGPSSPKPSVPHCRIRNPLPGWHFSSALWRCCVPARFSSSRAGMFDRIAATAGGWPGRG